MSNELELDKFGVIRDAEVVFAAINKPTKMIEGKSEFVEHSTLGAGYRLGIKVPSDSSIVKLLEGSGTKYNSVQKLRDETDTGHVLIVAESSALKSDGTKRTIPLLDTDRKHITNQTFLKKGDKVSVSVMPKIKGENTVLYLTAVQATDISASELQPTYGF